jgi:hypothetical protein
MADIIDMASGEVKNKKYAPKLGWYVLASNTIKGDNNFLARLCQHTLGGNRWFTSHEFSIDKSLTDVKDNYIVIGYVDLHKLQIIPVDDQTNWI